MIYGTDKVSLEDPGCAERVAAHSSAAVRRGTYKAKGPRTMRMWHPVHAQPTGCGAAVLEVVDRLPGEPGPHTLLPTDLLEARSAKRYNQPQIIGAPAKAYDEDNRVLVGCGGGLDLCTTASVLTSRRNVD